jgi:isocitrate lyase
MNRLLASKPPAGFGEPLHSMRTMREFIRAGIAGVRRRTVISVA